jgi:hypothetical protein
VSGQSLNGYNTMSKGRRVPIAASGDRLLWSIELNRPLLSYAKLSAAAVKARTVIGEISKLQQCDGSYQSPWCPEAILVDALQYFSVNDRYRATLLPGMCCHNQSLTTINQPSRLLLFVDGSNFIRRNCKARGVSF